jgi:hypothetical protein
MSAAVDVKDLSCFIARIVNAKKFTSFATSSCCLKVVEESVLILSELEVEPVLSFLFFKHRCDWIDKKIIFGCS